MYPNVGPGLALLVLLEENNHGERSSSSSSHICFLVETCGSSFVAKCLKPILGWGEQSSFGSGESRVTWDEDCCKSKCSMKGIPTDIPRPENHWNALWWYFNHSLVTVTLGHMPDVYGSVLGSTPSSETCWDAMPHQELSTETEAMAKASDCGQANAGWYG